MTPITRERIIRQALQAILEGEGTVDSRLRAVSGLLEKLPPAERRKILRALKPKLTRALRQKTATVRAATPLSSELKTLLQKISDEKGMLFLEELLEPKLLAGFSLQLGDDRTDYSLKGRVKLFADTNI